MIRNLLEIVKDILFPKFCVGCKKEGRYLCSECTLFISESGFICPVCGKGEFFGRRHKNCLKREQMDGLVNLWDYEGVVKNLIHETKYSSLIDIPKELMEYGFYSIINNKERFSEFLLFLLNEKTVISYVSLHKKRKNIRGFDQAEEIAKNLAQVAGKEVSTLLKREKETKSQINLNKEERLLNVKDAFLSIGKEAKQVVLVDDVWTSGATMRECAKVLKKNGVEKVWGFTLTKVA